MMSPTAVECGEVVTCKILEMNNNTTECVRTLSEEESQFKDKDNPFTPSGPVSTDAEIMLNLWRQKRLDAWGLQNGQDKTVKVKNVEVIEKHAPVVNETKAITTQVESDKKGCCSLM